MTDSPTPRREDVRARLSAETDQLLREGLHFGLGIVLVTNLLYIATDILRLGVLDAGRYAFHSLQIAMMTVVFVLTRKGREVRHPLGLGVAVVAGVYATTAGAAVATGEPPTTALLFAAFAMATAALLPWGALPQLASVSAAALALGVSVQASGKTLVDDLGFTFLIGLTAIFGGSVVLAAQSYRQRERSIYEQVRRERAEQRLRELNVSLAERVAESTAELRAANRELASFSYAVSHDLRTPLRSVHGFMHALVERCQDSIDEEGMHYVNRVDAATRRMDELIDGLLALARVTPTELARSEVDLSEMARGIAEELRRDDPTRKAELHIAEGLIDTGDRRLLRSVLANLLGNAWKYTARSPRPRIEFGRYTTEGHLVYYVRDNGVGFDMSRSHELFAPFRRLHDDREFPGSGIGLATVERIIQRHGGRVWAEAAPGQGATFYFTLYAAASTVAA